MTRRVWTWLAAAATAAVVLTVVGALMVGMAVVSVVTSTSQQAAAGSDDCLAPGVVSYGRANTDKRYFTAEENAGRIYAQAHGLGLGDVAALAGITAALQESSLKNGTSGDLFGSDSVARRYGASVGDMTQSRGMFQQTAAWVESGRAWSGLKWTGATSKSHFSDINPVTGAKDPWNPWTGTQWAVRDPRMDNAQATNMFFLGPAYNTRKGLEDSATFKAIRSTPVDQVSDADIARMVQDTQAAGVDRALQMVPTARTYLARITSGQIAVPEFETPETAIAKRASTPASRKALRLDSATPISGPDVATTTGDGLLLVGDSVMQGIKAYNTLPKEAFSGPVKVLAQRSMTLSDVLTRTGVKTVAGTKANLDTWRDTIANGPSRILVELGTNGSSANTVAGIRSFMDLAGPGREVFWYSMHYDKAKAFDDALLEAAHEYPNLHIVDVSGLIDDYSQMHPPADVSRQMWTRALDQMNGSTATPALLIAVSCGGQSVNAFNETIEPTGPYQKAAITWARQHLTSVTGGRYVTYATTDPDDEDFNCSTYTSAAYRAATGDAVSLVGYSDTQWQDTKHIQLIPASEAQPGDLLWQKTHPDKLTGHVLLIESVTGDGSVLHAANPTDGIVRGTLKNRGSYVALKDPSNPSRGADNIRYTDNWDEAYVGRVIIPTAA